MPEPTLTEPSGMYCPAGYAQAACWNGLVFVAGQVARDEHGVLQHPHDAALQATLVYDNLRRVLEAAGSSLRQVVKVTTYLTNSADAPAVAEVRRAAFGTYRPPHTGLTVAALGAPEVRVEVDVIATGGKP